MRLAQAAHNAVCLRIIQFALIDPFEIINLAPLVYTKLQQRAADNKPVRIGLIGAGKFGSMYLAQIPRTPGVHLLGIADLSPDAARANLEGRY